MSGRPMLLSASSQKVSHFTAKPSVSMALAVGGRFGVSGSDANFEKVVALEAAGIDVVV